MRPLLLFLLACALTGCYEERSGCLDPDAADYDLQADVACPDCCTYPELSVRVSSAWGDTTVVVCTPSAADSQDAFDVVFSVQLVGGVLADPDGDDNGYAARGLDVLYEPIA